LPPESNEPRRVARFGLFEVDLDRGELRREGRRLAIQKHPLLILSALLEEAGEEVSREQLRQRLWPDGEFLDFENGINTAVGRLRQVLGDSAENPRFIGTRRGHGYRLLTPVTWAAPAPSSTSISGAFNLRWRFWAFAASAALSVMIGVTFLWRWTRATTRSAAPPQSWIVPQTDPLLVYAPSGAHATGSFALSPAGDRLAFVIGGTTSQPSRIWIRSLHGVAVRALEGSDDGAMPFWSPDGRMLGFFADGHLKKIDVESGRVATLADAPRGRGGTWSRSGVILFAPDVESAILAVSESGGRAIPATDITGGASHRFPFFLPDGRHFLYLVLREDRDQSEVWSGELGSAGAERLLSAGSNAVYTTGTLIFARGPALLAQTFDPETRRVSGPPVVVSERVGVYGEEGPTGLGAFSVSATGALATADFLSPALGFSWFDRKGQRLDGAASAGPYSLFDLSADGNRIALIRVDSRKHFSDVVTVDLRTGLQTQLTDDPWPDGNPVWAPGGDRIAFTSLRDRHWRSFVREVTRRGQEREVGQCRNVYAWFPDGKSIVCGHDDDLWKISVDDPGVGTPIVAHVGPVADARVSPDEMWLAFSSDRSSDQNGRRRELYVLALGKNQSSAPTSLGRGDVPRWRSDGRELIFLAGRTLMAVSVDSRSGTRFGQPMPLFEAPVHSRDSLADIPEQFGVSPDGNAFLLSSPADTQSRTAIQVILR